MLEQIREQVYTLLNQDNSAHGMDHIDRVLSLSLNFAEKEDANEEIVALLALLHDVDDYKLFGEKSADHLTNAKHIMNLNHISQEIQEQVCLAIQSIGYKKRLKGIEPKTLEGKIVSDADMCDALGATGILRVYHYQLANNKPFFDKDIPPIDDITVEKYKLCADTGVGHMFEKILRLPDLMLTNAGKEEAGNRFQIVVDFLLHLFEEENAPKWSEHLKQYVKKNSTKKSPVHTGDFYFTKNS